jgi:hypothetical protein
MDLRWYQQSLLLLSHRRLRKFGLCVQTQHQSAASVSAARSKRLLSRELDRTSAAGLMLGIS